ncbi:uncharacterized protein LOC133779858 [Humulus lupulus]|uniref:uncharacterized protein LOC133779858 n=1 Tax=Humulus lupulus TaxID=3486 RepID=UPI002B4015A6|nr:uncharacterized protein LOC133779858 [Humulus lupulus]
MAPETAITITSTDLQYLRGRKSEEMEQPGAPDLRIAFQARKPGAGPVVKRLRDAKKTTPVAGNTSKFPAKSKDTSSTHEPATVNVVTEPFPPLERCSHLLKAALNAAKESEEAAKAALTAAQKNEQATKAALTTSQENEQAAKIALSASQAQAIKAQVKIGELKARLLEVEIKAKEERAASSSSMEEMLYQC